MLLLCHICGTHSTEKIDTLNKRILRFILQGYNSPYDSLLSKVNSKSLYRGIHADVIVYIFANLRTALLTEGNMLDTTIIS